MLLKMQDKHLYEYSVIRVVPRVEREEFINVGIILFCTRQRYLKSIIHFDKSKILNLWSGSDFEQIEKNLESFVKICETGKQGGPISHLEEAERFRWLTAVRSSVIQTSRPHPGFSTNLDTTINRLVKEIVL